MQIAFENSYARLPERFYARLEPTPVRAPRLLRLNDTLAAELGLDATALRSEAGVAILAGNAVPEGAEPLAQAYAGHQFGGWVPQLGDGRAILLGEVVGADGRRDIQLKGSGPTPFSRSGDGRAWIGPVLREYVVSEAMHALGIPTTRALAAVATGETVLREAALPGAVLTRVAQSHIRVGTFQYFLARNDTEALATLSDHAIRRHYPGATGPLDLLRRVVAAQAELVAGWMSVGFIHGVMNTDNTSVAGETIDYGPCAFMDRYHPDTVFSSIDQWGRYAYAQQPQVAAWNLAQFATALLPLMGERDAAIEAATKAVQGFAPAYHAAWTRAFGAKLGLADPGEGTTALAHDFLDIMAARGDDFTRTFRALAEDAEMPPEYQAWRTTWEPRRPDRALMRRANPAIIPRNHRVEEAIAAAVAGDLAPFHALADATARPYDTEVDHPLAAPPAPGAEVTRTFCGT
jgi:uncharacterized protein YdiU (UPF0061 family)